MPCFNWDWCEALVLALQQCWPLESLSLNAGDGDNANYIFCRAATGKIVNWCSNTLKDRTVCFSLRKTLNKLVSYVSGIEVGEDEGICLAGNW